jgi:hypothetical protein
MAQIRRKVLKPLSRSDKLQVVIEHRFPNVDVKDLYHVPVTWTHRGEQSVSLPPDVRGPGAPTTRLVDAHAGPTWAAAKCATQGMSPV